MRRDIRGQQTLPRQLGSLDGGWPQCLEWERMVEIKSGRCMSFEDIQFEERDFECEVFP